MTPGGLSFLPTALGSVSAWPLARSYGVAAKSPVPPTGGSGTMQLGPPRVWVCILAPSRSHRP